MANPVELWKSEKHPLDVWPDVVRYSRAKTSPEAIEPADLERMKWHGYFHRKRDGEGRFMNRIRITAGELSADQAREVARIAYEHGHGIIDVTTRANLQVQGLPIEFLPEVTGRLARVGLSAQQTGHDNIRNVFAHPYSGLLPVELIDTRPLCHAVTELFLGSRVYSDLPRKLNVCLNGFSEHSAHFWTQDVSFLATQTDEDVAFQLLIAGTQGQNPQLARHVPVLVRPDQVVAVTRAVFDLFRARGSREKRNAARLRYLVDEIGISGVLDWLEQTLPFRLQPCTRPPFPASTYDELIGWHRQQDPKKWIMGLSVPLGRLTWQQLEGLAILSRRYGDGQLRTTHEQGLAVVNIPTGFKTAAATEAAALGLSVYADDLERNTMACTGQQFCNIAVTETKGHMLQLIERLRRKSLKLHGIRIHMSGCPSSCAQHFTADIGLKGVRVRRLVGTREGFDVYLGGGISGQVHLGLCYKLGVDVDQLPLLVEEVVAEYYLRHKTGQTFSAYWREKLHALEAAKVGDTDYRRATWVCEKCNHQHAGEDPPIFCPACAGLRRYFARLEDSSPEAANQPTAAPECRAAPSAPAAREDGFLPLIAVQELHRSPARTVTVQGRELAVLLADGEMHVFDSECPHAGARLAEGNLQGGVLTCAAHGWSFDVGTGCSVDPKGHAVSKYPTLVDEGWLFVQMAGALVAVP
ncbi:MAG: precorrin-3B synthase [Planctomycetales bacterium]